MKLSILFSSFILIFATLLSVTTKMMTISGTTTTSAPPPTSTTTAAPSNGNTEIFPDDYCNSNYTFPAGALFVHRQLLDDFTNAHLTPAIAQHLGQTMSQSLAQDLPSYIRNTGSYFSKDSCSSLMSCPDSPSATTTTASSSGHSSNFACSSLTSSPQQQQIFDIIRQQLIRQCNDTIIADMNINDRSVRNQSSSSGNNKIDIDCESLLGDGAQLKLLEIANKFSCGIWTGDSNFEISFSTSQVEQLNVSSSFRVAVLKNSKQETERNLNGPNVFSGLSVSVESQISAVIKIPFSVWSQSFMCASLNMSGIFPDNVVPSYSSFVTASACNNNHNKANWWCGQKGTMATEVQRDQYTVSTDDADQNKKEAADLQNPEHFVLVPFSGSIVFSVDLRANSTDTLPSQVDPQQPGYMVVGGLAIHLNKSSVQISNNVTSPFSVVYPQTCLNRKYNADSILISSTNTAVNYNETTQLVQWVPSNEMTAAIDSQTRKVWQYASQSAINAVVLQLQQEWQSYGMRWDLSSDVLAIPHVTGFSVVEFDQMSHEPVVVVGGEQQKMGIEKESGKNGISETSTTAETTTSILNTTAATTTTVLSTQSPVPPSPSPPPYPPTNANEQLIPRNGGLIVFFETSIRLWTTDADPTDGAAILTNRNSGKSISGNFFEPNRRRGDCNWNASNTIWNQLKKQVEKTSKNTGSAEDALPYVSFVTTPTLLNATLNLQYQLPNFQNGLQSGVASVDGMSADGESFISAFYAFRFLTTSDGLLGYTMASTPGITFDENETMWDLLSQENRAEREENATFRFVLPNTTIAISCAPGAAGTPFGPYEIPMTLTLYEENFGDFDKDRELSPFFDGYKASVEEMENNNNNNTNVTSTTTTTTIPSTTMVPSTTTTTQPPNPFNPSNIQRARTVKLQLGLWQNGTNVGVTVIVNETSLSAILGDVTARTYFSDRFGAIELPALRYFVTKVAENFALDVSVALKKIPAILLPNLLSRILSGNQTASNFSTIVFNSSIENSTSPSHRHQDSSADSESTIMVRSMRPFVALFASRNHSEFSRQLSTNKSVWVTPPPPPPLPGASEANRDQPMYTEFKLRVTLFTIGFAVDELLNSSKHMNNNNNNQSDRNNSNSDVFDSRDKKMIDSYSLLPGSSESRFRLGLGTTTTTTTKITSTSAPDPPTTSSPPTTESIAPGAASMCDWQNWPYSTIQTKEVRYRMKTDDLVYRAGPCQPLINSSRGDAYYFQIAQNGSWLMWCDEGCQFCRKPPTPPIDQSNPTFPFSDRCDENFPIARMAATVVDSSAIDPTFSIGNDQSKMCIVDIAKMNQLNAEKRAQQAANSNNNDENGGTTTTVNPYTPAPTPVPGSNPSGFLVSFFSGDSCGNTDTNKNNEDLLFMASFSDNQLVPSTSDISTNISDEIGLFPSVQFYSVKGMNEALGVSLAYRKIQQSYVDPYDARPLDQDSITFQVGFMCQKTFLYKSNEQIVPGEDKLYEATNIFCRMKSATPLDLSTQIISNQQNNNDNGVLMQNGDGGRSSQCVKLAIGDNNNNNNLLKNAPSYSVQIWRSSSVRFCESLPPAPPAKEPGASFAADFIYASLLFAFCCIFYAIIKTEWVCLRFWNNYNRLVSSRPQAYIHMLSDISKKQLPTGDSVRDVVRVGCGLLVLFSVFLVRNLFDFEVLAGNFIAPAVTMRDMGMAGFAGDSAELLQNQILTAAQLMTRNNLTIQAAQNANINYKTIQGAVAHQRDVFIYWFGIVGLILALFILFPVFRAALRSTEVARTLVLAGGVVVLGVFVGNLQKIFTFAPGALPVIFPGDKDFLRGLMADSNPHDSIVISALSHVATIVALSYGAVNLQLIVNVVIVPAFASGFIFSLLALIDKQKEEKIQYYLSTSSKKTSNNDINNGNDNDKTVVAPSTVCKECMRKHVQFVIMIAFVAAMASGITILPLLKPIETTPRNLIWLVRTLWMSMWTLWISYRAMNQQDQALSASEILKLRRRRKREMRKKSKEARRENKKNSEQNKQQLEYGAVAVASTDDSHDVSGTKSPQRKNNQNNNNNHTNPHSAPLPLSSHSTASVASNNSRRSFKALMSTATLRDISSSDDDDALDPYHSNAENGLDESDFDNDGESLLTFDALLSPRNLAFVYVTFDLLLLASICRLAETMSEVGAGTFGLLCVYGATGAISVGFVRCVLRFAPSSSETGQWSSSSSVCPHNFFTLSDEVKLDDGAKNDGKSKLSRSSPSIAASMQKRQSRFSTLETRHAAGYLNGDADDEEEKRRLTHPTSGAAASSSASGPNFDHNTSSSAFSDSQRRTFILKTTAQFVSQLFIMVGINIAFYALPADRAASDAIANKFISVLDSAFFGAQQKDLSNAGSLNIINEPTQQHWRNVLHEGASLSRGIILAAVIIQWIVVVACVLLLVMIFCANWLIAVKNFITRRQFLNILYWTRRACFGFAFVAQFVALLGLCALFTPDYLLSFGIIDWVAFACGHAGESDPASKQFIQMAQDVLGVVFTSFLHALGASQALFVIAAVAPLVIVLVCMVLNDYVPFIISSFFLSRRVQGSHQQQQQQLSETTNINNNENNDDEDDAENRDVKKQSPQDQQQPSHQDPQQSNKASLFLLFYSSSKLREKFPNHSEADAAMFSTVRAIYSHFRKDVLRIGAVVGLVTVILQSVNLFRQVDWAALEVAVAFLIIMLLIYAFLGKFPQCWVPTFVKIFGGNNTEIDVFEDFDDDRIVHSKKKTTGEETKSLLASNNENSSYTDVGNNGKNDNDDGKKQENEPNTISTKQQQAVPHNNSIASMATTANANGEREMDSDQESSSHNSESASALQRKEQERRKREKMLVARAEQQARLLFKMEVVVRTIHVLFLIIITAIFAGIHSHDSSSMLNKDRSSNVLLSQRSDASTKEIMFLRETLLSLIERGSTSFASEGSNVLPGDVIGGAGLMMSIGWAIVTFYF